MEEIHHSHESDSAPALPSETVDHTEHKDDHGTNTSHSPEPAPAVIDETQKAHILPLRCACSHRQGMCVAPLDPTFSHTFDCRWVCCDQQWSAAYCSLTTEEVADWRKQPPGVLQFAGNKKGHVSTARQLRFFVCDRGELKYYAARLNVAPYGKDLKGTVRLKGYKVVTELDTSRIYLQPSLKGTKDLDIELDDHISVRDYVAGELTRHIELADTLYTDEEAMSPTRQSSVDTSSSPLFKPRPDRSASTNNLTEAAPSSPSADTQAASPQSTDHSSSPTPGPVTTAVATDSESKDASASIAVSGEDVDVKVAPALVKFWAQKKGHVNVGMKARYFVLHAGTLSYYLSATETPPYGKDLKGSVYLANYEIMDTSTLSSNQPNDLRIYIQNKIDDSKDMDLQFAVKALKDEVEIGLSQHIKYATACRKFDVDAEQTRDFLVSMDSTASPSASVNHPSAAASSIASSTRPVVKRMSTLSIFSSSSSAALATSSAAAAFPKAYTLTAEDRSKWSLFLPQGESVVATAPVNKPNPVGKTLIRQIVLTSGAKLIYIDPTDNSVKGTIDVAAGRSLWPIAKAVSSVAYILSFIQCPVRFLCFYHSIVFFAMFQESETAFIVREAKGSREYKFIDTVYGAKFWVDTITGLHKSS